MRFSKLAAPPALALAACVGAPREAVVVLPASAPAAVEAAHVHEHAFDSEPELDCDLAPPAAEIPGEPEPDAAAPAESPAIEVVVGAFAFDGDWYQDGSTHRHDIATPFARKVGDGLEVTIARDRDHGNVDLTLCFARDAAGRTVVTPRARWYAPRRARGPVDGGPLDDLRGFVQLQAADWSPGNALNCRFALLGTDRTRTVFLTGAFLVRNPAR